MSMTKKDFERIAAALAESQARNAVINAVSDACATLCPAFKADRFKAAAKAATPEETARRVELRELADEQHGEEGGLEIDADAAISEGDDNGAYVAAWLWVDFTGTKFDKSKPCDDCVGIGKIRREGETPKLDTWDPCATCQGSGEVL